MSLELINRMSIKKDGVYISTKSSNCDEPYRAVYNSYLSKAYLNEGILGLDKIMWELLLDCVKIRGNHPSLIKYKRVIESNDFDDLVLKYDKECAEIYNKYGNTMKAVQERNEAHDILINRLVAMSNG